MSIGEQHIVRSFDEELRRLDDGLARMCGLTEAQVAGALKALAERDLAAAARVAEGDRLVDECERFVEEQTLRLLALRAPVADDLRMVVTCLKVATNIERVADHAASCARRVLGLAQQPTPAPMRAVLRLGLLAQQLLKESFDAFLSRDADRARAVWARDQEADALYSSLFREILTHMMEDPRTITVGSHLMFIAKNLERIGDHATNIAEMAVFLSTGRTLSGERPKNDRSSFESGAA
jgi:phosphate transport system protein